MLVEIFVDRNGTPYIYANNVGTQRCNLAVDSKPCCGHLDFITSSVMRKETRLLYLTTLQECHGLDREICITIDLYTVVNRPLYSPNPKRLGTFPLLETVSMLYMIFDY